VLDEFPERQEEAGIAPGNGLVSEETANTL